MYSQQSRAETSDQCVQLESLFSPEERTRLLALRRRVIAVPDPQDCGCGIDPRRLEFVCWLVQHGKLSEVC